MLILAKLLASKGIVSMEDLAELAADELLDLVKVDEEKAKAFNHDSSCTMVCLNNLLEFNGNIYSRKVCN